MKSIHNLFFTARTLVSATMLVVMVAILNMSFTSSSNPITLSSDFTDGRTTFDISNYQICQTGNVNVFIGKYLSQEQWKKNYEGDITFFSEDPTVFGTVTGYVNYPEEGVRIKLSFDNRSEVYFLFPTGTKQHYYLHKVEIYTPAKISLPVNKDIVTKIQSWRCKN